MPEVIYEDLERNFHLLRTAPEKYLALAEGFIRAHPDSPDGYWSRYQAFDSLKKHDLALADLDRVLSYEKEWIIYECRGNTLRALGRYQEALDDYNRAEAIDPEGWYGGFGRLFRAECHARLGNEKAALEDCAALRDDHWTPGLLGAPAGNKDQVMAEVQRLTAQAREGRRP
jgi:tetratricopeptide (TPR) repeat protein